MDVVNFSSLNLTGKKKRKKKRLEDIEHLTVKSGNEKYINDEGKLVNPENSESDYKYAYLLSRVYKDNKLTEIAKTVLVAPEVNRIARKSFWTNCQHFCSSIGRDCNHVTHFIISELSTTGSFDNYGTYIIKGRYDCDKIQSVLRQYIASYVICDACKSLNTYLERDPSNRLLMLICSNCSCKRSVQRIQTGFIANI